LFFFTKLDEERESRVRTLTPHLIIVALEMGLSPTKSLKYGKFVYKTSNFDGLGRIPIFLHW